jgi:hypothetical protein
MRNLLIVMVAAWVLSGCAQADNEVRLRYAGPASAPVLSRGRVAVPPAEERVWLPRNKQGRVVVGLVRSGFAGDFADVLTDDSPGQWVQSAVVSELRARSYDAVTVEAPLAPERLVVSTQLMALNRATELQFLTIAEQVTIRVIFRVHREGRLVTEFEITALGTHRAPISGPAARQAAYDASIKVLMKEAVPKLDAALAGT